MKRRSTYPKPLNSYVKKGDWVTLVIVLDGVVEGVVRSIKGRWITVDVKVPGRRSACIRARRFTKQLHQFDEGVGWALGRNTIAADALRAAQALR